MPFTYSIFVTCYDFFIEWVQGNPFSTVTSELWLMFPEPGIQVRMLKVMIVLFQRRGHTLRQSKGFYPCFQMNNLWLLTLCNKSNVALQAFFFSNLHIQRIHRWLLRDNEFVDKSWVLEFRDKEPQTISMIEIMGLGQRNSRHFANICNLREVAGLMFRCLEQTHVESYVVLLFQEDEEDALQLTLSILQQNSL